MNIDLKFHKDFIFTVQTCYMKELKLMLSQNFNLYSCYMLTYILSC